MKYCILLAFLKVMRFVKSSTRQQYLYVFIVCSNDAEANNITHIFTSKDC